MVEPWSLRSFYLPERWFDIQGFRNFTAAHFVTNSQTVNFFAKLHLCCLVLILETAFFQSLPKNHDQLRVCKLLFFDHGTTKLT